MSNFQPTDLTALIQQAGARHVVVRLPVPGEPVSFTTIARAQLGSALHLGCTVSGYFWPYDSNTPQSSIDYALDAAAYPLTMLWPDIERSQYAPVPLGWLGQAGTVLASKGLRKGLYSSAEQWKAIYGAVTLGPDWLGWAAGYDGIPNLDVPGFGGVRIVGKQFTSTPVDTSVFLPEVCG